MLNRTGWKTAKQCQHVDPVVSIGKYRFLPLTSKTIYIYLQVELVTGRNGTDLKAKEKHELTDAPKERKSITHTRENKQNKNICQEYCGTYNAYYNTYRKTICLFFLLGVFWSKNCPLSSQGELSHEKVEQNLKKKKKGGNRWSLYV